MRTPCVQERPTDTVRASTSSSPDGSRRHAVTQAELHTTPSWYRGQCGQAVPPTRAAHRPRGARARLRYDLHHGLWLGAPQLLGRVVRGGDRGGGRGGRTARVLDCLDDRSRAHRPRVRGRVRADLRGDSDARPRRRPDEPAEARDERHRRPTATGRRSRQGAGDARQPHPWPTDRRGRRRLERGRVCAPRGRRSLPRPRRVPGRDHPAVAAPLVGVGRTVRRALQPPDGLRVRAAAGTDGGTADRRRRCVRRALRRAGMLGDGYHFSVAPPPSVAERVPRVRAAAESAGRPMPPVSGRVTLRFDAPPPAAGQPYAMTGAPEVVAAEVRAYAGAGVDHLALVLRETDPARYVAIAERFAKEVMPLVG